MDGLAIWRDEHTETEGTGEDALAAGGRVYVRVFVSPGAFGQHIQFVIGLWVHLLVGFGFNGNEEAGEVPGAGRLGENLGEVAEGAVLATGTRADEVEFEGVYEGGADFSGVGWHLEVLE